MEILQKKDCGNTLTEEYVREAQLEMLDTLTSFVKANGLRYYLSGGTLLGAVRHKGFIPWDDDIDINMPRPDCEKLYELCGGRIGKYVLCRGGEDDRYNIRCFWYRLYDPGIIVESFMGGVAREPYYMPLFIDIFPIEGFPKGALATKVFCGRLILRSKILQVAANKKVYGKTALRKAAHYAAYLPIHLIGYRFWCRRFLRLARKYSFDRSEYVGATTIVHYLPREKVEKQSYTAPVQLEFEGRRYDCPGSYDTYLANLYGDYMKLPPEEKRRSDHVFHFYERRIGE